MDFETRRQNTPQVNLSALIDVAFILVIFIVLAANFDRIQKLDVSLPEALASRQADPTSLTITIPANGPVLIGDRAVEPGQVGAVLRSVRAKYKSVLLLADQSAPIQRAVEILGEVRALNFDSVGIATKTPGGP
jgi:biopolymer transport protein ExbD